MYLMSFVMMYNNQNNNCNDDDDNEATSCSYRQRVHASRLVQMQVGDRYY